MGKNLRTVLLVLVLMVSAFALSQGGKSLGRPARTIGQRVLAVGDSITLGAGSPGGYRAILESRLLSEGFKFDFVGGSTENSNGLVSPRHEGHGGWSTTDLVNGKAGQGAKGKLADWLRASNPDTVLVMTGTNDSVWVTKQEWTAKYERLLDAIYKQNRNMKVVLASIPKSNNAVTGKDWGEAMCYDIVKSVVASRRAKGYKITFADTYTSFNPSVDLADDYHPNANGYRKIANAFYGALLK